MKEVLESNQIIPILMSGLPGKMAALVAEKLCGNGNFRLHQVGLSSINHAGETVTIADRNIHLLHSSIWPVFFTRRHGLYDMNRGTVAIDFSTPGSAAENANFFANHNIPFVMGTSGGNREEMEEIIRKSRTCEVVAANMDPQIIRQQMNIDKFAQTNPDIFREATIEITESHQKTKKDVSDTAIAFRAQFERYGVVPNGTITSIRDTEAQEALGILSPDSGHAYHWVAVKNPAGEVIYQFNTAVQGRSSYVEGTLMAARFLYRQIADGARGQVFSMRDVMEGGE